MDGWARPWRRLNPIQGGAVAMLPIGLLVLAAFFYGPLLGLLAQSLQPASASSAGPLSTYIQLGSEGSFTAVVANSFAIAGSAFTVMFIAGYPIAYIVAFRVSRSRQLVVLLLLILSGSVSDIVRIFAWTTILGFHGIINEFLLTAGLIHAPLGFLLYSPFAVTIVLAAGWLPYVVVPIYAAMRAIDRSAIEVARDLYARPIDVVRYVVFPLSFPGVLGAFIIVFVPLLTEFATPQMVGGPSSLMLGNLVSDQILAVGNWPVGSAAAVMLLVLALVLITAAQRLSVRAYGR